MFPSVISAFVFLPWSLLLALLGLPLICGTTDDLPPAMPNVGVQSEKGGNAASAGHGADLMRKEAGDPVGEVRGRPTPTVVRERSSRCDTQPVLNRSLM